MFKATYPSKPTNPSDYGQTDNIVNYAEASTYYVIDTNVIIDYPEIIPNGDSHFLARANIDLNRTHLIITTTVIDELSNFKHEHSERGKVARAVLNRLNEITKQGKLFKNYDEQLKGQTTFIRTVDDQTFFLSVISTELVLSKNYDPCTKPDWQIIQTAKALSEILPARVNVVILTNDNGLAANARAYNVKAEGFHYEGPKPWTGRRTVVVTKTLLQYFLDHKNLPADQFYLELPAEEKLIPNEFIIFVSEPEEDPYQEYQRWHDYSNVGRYDQATDCILPLIFHYSTNIKPLNINQALYLEALVNPEISAVLVTGPAGSGKTYLATLRAYEACKEERQYLRAVVIPCVVDNNIGYLPGNIDEKLEPQIQAIKEALKNYLVNDKKENKKRIEQYENQGEKSKKHRVSEKLPQKTQESKNPMKNLEDNADLIYDNWFDTVSVDYARGRSFIKSFLIVDEFQDQSLRQADTLLKRLGQGSKIIIAGDIDQIHAAHLDRRNNGIAFASEVLCGSPLVARIHFEEEDVVRHPLVKHIVERQKRK